MPGFEPTTEQQAMIDHNPANHARILAGPGTGKSATLVAFIDRLLNQPERPRIKLLTFTRAATQELTEKTLNHPAIAEERPSTIHSFAISILLQNPGTGNFPEPLRIADDWEYKNIVRPTLAQRAGVTVKKLDLLVQEMAAKWESLVPEQDPQVNPTDRSRFLGAWNEHRWIYGYTLLAELPDALRVAIRDHTDLQGINFNLLLVDEYQDLNACDLEVLTRLSQRGCVIVAAGDDDQSIYKFRRAAPEGIRRFLTDYVGALDYPLSITQRCGSRIVEWASYVIEGDPDRPTNRPRLRSLADSPPGEIAILSFAGQAAEAKGVAKLVQALIEKEVPASEILILLRGDHNASFSKPIKEALAEKEISCVDQDYVKRILADEGNRFFLEAVHLLVNRTDSIAWASLLRLTDRIGEGFLNYIYEKARGTQSQTHERLQFGVALLQAYQDNFADGPASVSGKAKNLVESVLHWIESHPIPETPENGWGRWMIETSLHEGIAPAPTDDLKELLLQVDSKMEPELGFGRYLGQIAPLGKDINLAKSDGVRIMSMAGSKGLTVRATIIVGVEEGIIPRPDADPAEERRLLYVGMTRAREFLFCTWARRRRGPTARAGRSSVGDRRQHSTFFAGGPIESEDAASFFQRFFTTRIN